MIIYIGLEKLRLSESLEKTLRIEEEIPSGKKINDVRVPKNKIVSVITESIRKSFLSPLMFIFKKN